jgi:type IV pilus assembly protein PilV
MSRGFSLVEALVALAVLSLGLLGAAGMLLSGLRDQSQALQRSSAGMLVAGMQELVRANPDARAAYDTRSVRGPARSCDATAPCDTAALAARDLAWFEREARRVLPLLHSRVSIHFEPAIGPAATDRYFISLSWREARDPEATGELSVVLLAQPVAGDA